MSFEMCHRCSETSPCFFVRTAPPYFERTKLRDFSLCNLVTNATPIIQYSFVSGYENFQSNSSYGSISDPASP